MRPFLSKVPPANMVTRHTAPPQSSSGDGPGSTTTLEKLLVPGTPLQFFAGPGVATGNTERAKAELARAQVEHVMLVLSSGVGAAGQETAASGVFPEAAALIDACKLLNKVVTLVAPEVTVASLRQFMKPTHPEFAEYGRFIGYGRDAGEAGHAVGTAQAKFHPDLVVGIGVPVDDRKAIKAAIGRENEGRVSLTRLTGKVPEASISDVLGKLADSGEPIEKKLGTLIAVDSGTGGVVGAKVSATSIMERTPFKVQVIALADIGKAPYGQYNNVTLPPIVNALLQSAEEVLPRAMIDEVESELNKVPISVKCNTACTALANTSERVVNLIANTALTIVRDGGERPAIVGTPVTAANSAYPLAVYAASQGQIEPKMIGAHKDLADMYNRMEHLSDDPAIRAKYNAIIKAVVDEVPNDATSLSLCCTHYPLGIDDFRRELAKQRKEHVRVINPMPEHQTEEIIARLYEQRSAFPPAPDDDLPPVILTTGNLAETDAAARQIWGGPVIVIAVPEFGARKLDVQLVHGIVAAQNPRFRPRPLPGTERRPELPPPENGIRLDPQRPQPNA